MLRDGAGVQPSLLDLDFAGRPETAIDGNFFLTALRT
jgi:hypothetical protein